MMKRKLPRGEYGWNFAIVNGKLAEIHFAIQKTGIRVWGHCFVKREKFRTKAEQKMIDVDIKNNRLTWRNKKYKAVKGYAIESLIKV